MPRAAEQFIAKWTEVELPERDASQAHFRDLREPTARLLPAIHR